MTSCTPHSLSDYYRRASSALELSAPLAALGAKWELGCPLPERGYQSRAVWIARTASVDLHRKADKAAFLSLCQGICFPPFGRAGLDFLARYACGEGLFENKTALITAAASLALEDCSLPFPEDAERCLLALLSGDDSIPEVRVARLAQETVLGVKLLDRDPARHREMLLYRISEELCVRCAFEQRLCPPPFSDGQLAEIARWAPQPLTEEQQDFLLHRLEELRGFYSPGEAVCRSLLI